MLVVMYHYIREDNSDYPNFKNLTIDQFKKQIDFFYDTYGLISKEDFIRSIETKTPVKEGVVLTFDDGFKDHYNNVLPILNEKKLWGCFYIPTGHYGDQKILNVHRVHHLLGKYDANNLLKDCMKLIDVSMLDEDKIQQFDKEIYKDQQLSSFEYQFKRLFNYYLRDEFKTLILDTISKSYLDEAELYKSMYMTKNELIEIENQGSIVGSHTKTHPVLSTLSDVQQHDEIFDSFAFLDSFLRVPLRSFCYPYGGPSSYNKNTFDILEKCDVHHAFAVGNKQLEIPHYKYELTRMDCNRIC